MIYNILENWQTCLQVTLIIRQNNVSGTIIQKEIDTFVKKLGSGDVYGGDPAVAAKAIEKARNTWSRMRKTEVIDKLLENAPDIYRWQRKRIRNQISNILRSEKTSAVF